MIPENRYTKSVDGVHVAYQVIGDGPIDLVFVMGWTSNIEAVMDQSLRTALLEGGNDHPCEVRGIEAVAPPQHSLGRGMAEDAQEDSY